MKRFIFKALTFVAVLPNCIGQDIGLNDTIYFERKVWNEWGMSLFKSTNFVKFNDNNKLNDLVSNNSFDIGFLYRRWFRSVSAIQGELNICEQILPILSKSPNSKVIERFFQMPILFVNSYGKEHTIITFGIGPSINAISQQLFINVDSSSIYRDSREFASLLRIEPVVEISALFPVHSYIEKEKKISTMNFNIGCRTNFGKITEERNFLIIKTSSTNIYSPPNLTTFQIFFRISFSSVTRPQSN